MSINCIVFLSNVKEITVCSNIFLRKSAVQVIETNSGEALILNQSTNISIDVFGYTYFKSKNMKLMTHIEKEEEISRIALCTNRFSKRIIEIIELKDGTIIVSPLTKFIFMEKIDYEYLEGEVSKFRKS